MAKRKRSRITRDREGSSSPSGPRGGYAPHWADPMEHPKDLTPPVYRSLEEVPKDILERGLGKLRWIQRLLNEGCPRGKLVEYAESYGESQGEDVKVPAESTLRGWVHRHRHFGLLGLMDAVPSQGSRVLTPEMKDTIKVLRFGGKKKPAEALAALTRLFEGQVPSYATVRRSIRKLERENPHLRVLVDEGLPGFKNKLRLALAGGHFPAGTHISVDSTVADQLVRIPDRNSSEGWVERRVSITIVQDMGSRALLSFNVSLHAVDAGILLSTFRRAVVQEANYPGLVSLPTLPRKIYADHGSEHQAEFKETLEKWGVEIELGHPKEPEENARVERLIGTITDEVFKPEPGYSKCQKVFDPYADPDRESRRRLAQLKYEPIRMEVPLMALPTLGQLEHKLLAWAIEYNQRSHPSLPMDDEFMRMASIVEELEGLQEAA